MRGKKITLASGLAVCFLMSSAFAAMSVPYGWYVEGNAGLTRIADQVYPGSSSLSGSGIGGNVNVGYKFMPYFTAEMGYTRYANSDILDNNGTKAATDKHYSYDFVGKGIFPLYTSGFEAFAKLGLGRSVSSMSISNTTAANNIGATNSSHSATGLYYGIGIDYSFMAEFAANVQWATAVGNNNTGDVSLLSAGVSLFFS